VPTRILILGPVSPETLAALEGLPGGVTILAPADAHELLTRVASEQPDLIVEGSLAVDWAGSSSLLHQILDSEFARAVRYRHPLAILLVSVDGADALNATHGVQAADGFRAALSEAMRRSLRQIDVVARTGPNEFTVLLPETTAAGGRIVAERTRALASRLIVKGGRDGERRAWRRRQSFSRWLASPYVARNPRGAIGSSSSSQPPR
jgi:GGDEF domain-containing protein